ncbi:MAG TPA: hypothetical protein VMY35_03050 [Phycisphaerae bacterium]|nr:hypothetical protein [Phycisphaerae bacterium]
MLVAAVSPEELRVVIRLLVGQALLGDPWAIHELLDRCLGKAQQFVIAPADTERPTEVTINVGLGLLLAKQMEKLSEGPPAPGLRPLGQSKGESNGEAGND